MQYRGFEIKQVHEAMSYLGFNAQLGPLNKNNYRCAVKNN